MYRNISHTTQGEQMTEAVQVTTEAVQHLDLTTTWVGILSLTIFVVAYYFIAAEDKYHINIGSSAATAYIEQTIANLDWTVGDTVPRFTLSFEAMIDYADTSTYTLIRFGVRFRYDAATDQYLDGQIGGTPDDPVWQTASILTFYFTTEDGLPVSNQWYKFEFAIPAIAAGIDGDLEVRFYEGVVAGSGTINSWNVRGCKLMPTYDLTPPAKNRTLELPVSDTNIEVMPQKEIDLGDVDVDNNEGQLFFNSLTTDDAGILETRLWQSTRQASSTRYAVGPSMPLLDYIQDGYMIQNGSIRKRLSGRMVLDQSRWVMMAISEDSIYYAFTRLTVDLKRGEADVSLLEIPEITDLGKSLIVSWTNNDFDSFAATDELITSITNTGFGKYADSDDAIDYYEDDQFRVTCEGTMTANGFRLAFAGFNLVMTDGYDNIIQPTSAGPDTPRLSANIAGAISCTNMTITIKKLYGY